MAYCRHCGSKIDEDMFICPKCEGKQTSLTLYVIRVLFSKIFQIPQNIWFWGMAVLFYCVWWEYAARVVAGTSPKWASSSMFFGLCIGLMVPFSTIFVYRTLKILVKRRKFILAVYLLALIGCYYFVCRYVSICIIIGSIPYVLHQLYINCQNLIFFHSYLHKRFIVPIISSMDSWVRKIIKD